MASSADNVVQFSGATLGDIDPSNILQGAQESALTSVVLIGRTETGESYYASSTGDVASILLELELFKRSLLDEI